MRFKVLKGTQLFDELVALSNELSRCRKEALKIMKEVGGTYIRGCNMVVGGGISAIALPEKPDGWRNAYTDMKGEYMPRNDRASGKALADKIKVLPVVEYEVFKKLIKYDYHDHDTNRISFCPAVTWRPTYILIAISEQYPRYKPVKDMIEITTSEYNKLAEEKKKKKTIKA